MAALGGPSHKDASRTTGGSKAGICETANLFFRGGYHPLWTHRMTDRDGRPRWRGINVSVKPPAGTPISFYSTESRLHHTNSAPNLLGQSRNVPAAQLPYSLERETRPASQGHRLPPHRIAPNRRARNGTARSQASSAAALAAAALACGAFWTTALRAATLTLSALFAARTATGFPCSAA